MPRPTLATVYPTDGWLRAADARVGDLEALLDAGTVDAPSASRVERGIPVYAAADLAAHLSPELAADRPAADRARIQAELAAVLADGPGVLAITGAVPVPAVDRATAVFAEIVAQQRLAGTAAGDHFAKPGANDRIWNALEKLAIADPAAFADYYAAAAIALVCEAWLGPGYQMTSQVNVVNPGGAPQEPHRDYHLGFMTVAQAERYPAHVHRLSPALTLQGAVAHSDMPVETGPTMLLPHSQKFPHGYLVAGDPAFDELFARRHVQLPLRTGDAVFFNPALIHAAGRNRTTDVRRAANLLQVSSAFGRAMESVDRDRICRALYPELVRRGDSRAVRAVVAAAAEGYAFPTNLDRDPPVGGLAPPSQADLVLRAVAERWTPQRLGAALDEQKAKRCSS